MISRLFAEYLQACKKAGGTLDLAHEIALREFNENKGEEKHG